MCGEHVEGVRSASRGREVVALLKDSIALTSCVSSNAERIFEACKEEQENEAIEVDTIEVETPMMETEEYSEQQLEADEDCEARLREACPTRQILSAVVVDSAESYAAVVAENLAHVRCVQTSVHAVGASCAAVFARDLVALESLDAKRPCHDQLRKSCGAKFDKLENAIKDTSVIGILESAIEVVDCVLQHAEDIWAKCKPIEEGERAVLLLGDAPGAAAGKSKKPTPKPTKSKKPTPKPTSKKPTPKPTPSTTKPTGKPTSVTKAPTPKGSKGLELVDNAVFQNTVEEQQPELPAVQSPAAMACVEAVAERCSGLINRLASDYAPEAHVELEVQARACIVAACGEEQAALLLGESASNMSPDEPPMRPRRGPCMHRLAREHKGAFIGLGVVFVVIVSFVVKRRRFQRRAALAQREAEEASGGHASSATASIVVVQDAQESEYFRLKEDGRVAMGEVV
jgi:hypothetical protein